MRVMQFIRNTRIGKKLESMRAEGKKEEKRRSLEERELSLNLFDCKYDEFYRKKDEEEQWILQIYGENSKEYEEFLVELSNEERDYFGNYDIS